MSESDSTRPHLTGAARRILETVLATVGDRLQLFAVEFKLEKYRLIEVILLAAGAAVFAVLALVLFATTLILLVPADYRVHVVALVCAACALGALFAALRIRSRLKTPPPFNDTIAQLKKDREWFTTRK